MSEVRSLQNPGPLRAPKLWTQVCLALVAIGAGAFFAVFAKDPKQAWSLFVINHFYFMGLALGGVFFLATQSITGAMWGAPVRRVAESFSAYLPMAFVTSAVVIFFAHGIYEWMDRAAVTSDPLLRGKAGYLSQTGFAIRTAVALGLMYWISKKMVGNSLAQDASASHEPTARNRVWSPAFLIVFALGITFLGFDHLMSLDPHWFSTMFGIYIFAGLAYSTHAMLGIVTVLLRRQGSLKDFVNENHLHDIGKWMFAWTVFWAYVGFSQFMLIWYANLPEETGYFLRRFDTAWLGLSIFLIVGKFLLPFLLLLPRGTKRNARRIVAIGLYMLVAHWLDLLWVVQPEFFRGGPQVGLLGVLMSLGFFGIFGFMVLRFLGRHNVVAFGDPKLRDSVFHHHQ